MAGGRAHTVRGRGRGAFKLLTLPRPCVAVGADEFGKAICVLNCPETVPQQMAHPEREKVPQINRELNFDRLDAARP
jgi:hypothetical protein